MAQEIIFKKIVDTFSQEEIVENDELVQEHIYQEVELIVKQEKFQAENRSDIFAEVWLHASNKSDFEEGGYTIYTGNSASGGDNNRMYIDNYLYQDYSVVNNTGISVHNETKSILLSTFYSNGTTSTGAKKKIGRKNKSTTVYDKLNIHHYFNGTSPKINISGSIDYHTSNTLHSHGTGWHNHGNYNETIELLPIDRGTMPLTAISFNDEEDAYLTYDVAPSNSIYVGGYTGVNEYKNLTLYEYDEATQIQAALSFDGVNIDIPYRDIGLDGTSYTFNLTDAEREILRVKAQGSPNVPIYYMTKTTRVYNGEYVDFELATERVLTIVGCMPTLNPTVIDVNSDTIALTGNPNIFVRYESQVEFSTGATASKHATIVSQSVQCGSKTISNLYNGVISDIETGNFIFNATDSRGLHANQVVISNTGMIEYIKPTISQEVEIELSGETGAIITVSVRGNYFNGTFGAVDNTLDLYVRYASGKNELGDWVKLEGTPTLNGNTYELISQFSGLEYDSSYTFQCRAVDKLNIVETQSYTIKLLPVFDWSETDFNFNVPVNIDADNFNMHNNTIIRHSETTKNTVLSANGGHIYLRPGGTNSTAGETIIYPDGSIKFGGSVDLSDSLVDYIVDAGEASMGSNGTWYWRKWASGRAECYGCRNFGNMAVSTAWGNLFRSEILTQELPEDVFKRTPDVIDINIVSANFGGWICKHENTAPSAATTGSFIFVRPASATVSPTYIGFYIIGDWQ
jgi:hypothetical protein